MQENYLASIPLNLTASVPNKIRWAAEYTLVLQINQGSLMIEKENLKRSPLWEKFFPCGGRTREGVWGTEGTDKKIFLYQ